LSDEHAAQLIIVAFPYRTRVFATETSGPGYDLRLPQRYVEEFVKRNAIPFLDLLPPLGAYVKATGHTFNPKDDDHSNSEGHFVV
jgi:hypothetical protein